MIFLPSIPAYGEPLTKKHQRLEFLGKSRGVLFHGIVKTLQRFRRTAAPETRLQLVFPFFSYSGKLKCLSAFCGSYGTIGT